MLKKVASKNLYVLVENSYLDLENNSIVWNKEKKEYENRVPKNIIIYNNRVLFTDYKVDIIKPGTFQKEFLVYREDLKSLEFGELLPYIAKFNQVPFINNYFYYLNKLYSKNNSKNPSRIRKNIWLINNFMLNL